MLESHASKIDRWLAYTVMGCFATRRLASKLTLAAIVPVFLVIWWYFILGPFNAKVFSICFAFFCILALTALNALWRILPNEGRQYLDMIEDVFGPRTRAEVWKWWHDIQNLKNGGRGEKLDVEAIAKQVGEFRFGPSPESQSGM